MKLDIYLMQDILKNNNAKKNSTTYIIGSSRKAFYKFSVKEMTSHLSKHLDSTVFYVIILLLTLVF